MRTDELVIARRRGLRPVDMSTHPAAPAKTPARIMEFGYLDACYPGGLCAAGSVTNFAENRMIYGEGNPAEMFFKVVSGVVRTCTFLGNGRRQIDAFYVPGDLFGFETGQEHRLTAEAVCPAVLIAYPCRGVAILAASNAQLAHQLRYFAIRSLVQAQEHLALLDRNSATERVASFLIDWTTCFPAQDIVTLPMARLDIADYLGLTIEAVSRTLSRLQKRGLIALPNIRQVKLLDPAGLGDLRL